MGALFRKIKSILFPNPEKAVQKLIDNESLRNIYHLSFFAALFEILSLIIYITVTHTFDKSAWISMGSVVFCAVLCLVAFFVSQAMLRKETSHKAIMAFKLLFIALLNIWSIWVSYRQYLRSEQLFTFYTVQFTTICFILLKPWISIVIIGVIYTMLYFVLMSVAGSAEPNLLNFLVLALVAATGSIVRYYSQLRSSEKEVQLQNSNQMLEYSNRHDVLTGLRNRYALEEDVPSLIDSDIQVFMIDINYFKEINDTYGHIVGDLILKEVASVIRDHFPDSFRYRYGGDEFLVLKVAGKAFEDEWIEFDSKALNGKPILISIGRATGMPKNHHELFDLITAADVNLYDVKRKTHAPK